MQKTVKNKLGVFFIGGVFFLLALANVLSPKAEISISERRKLAGLPKLNLQTLANGSFAGNFESYAMDSFVGREHFRKMQSVLLYYGLGNRDIHGIYLSRGYGAEIISPLKESSVVYGAGKFREIYERDLKDTAGKVYYSVVFDKGYYAGEGLGSPIPDYGRMFDILKENLDFASCLDLSKVLSLECYYRTDPHWRQEKLAGAARFLAGEMGASGNILQEYNSVLAAPLFHGAYEGRMGLPMKGEPLFYVTNEAIENCVVTDAFGERMPGAVDLKKAEGLDPYELFLSGSQPVITMENPLCKNGKRLVLFRDSFGSSLAPLLLEAYERITLVDIRYVKSQLLKEYVDFEGADVLFLYSVLVLNDSFSLN